MNKTLLILRNELITTLTRRSFLFAAFAVPLIAILIFMGISTLNRNSPDIISSITGAPRESEIKVEGYVDHSGLIKSIPESVPEGSLVAFSDEASALEALEAEEIAAFYIIPADYVQEGVRIYVDPEANPLESDGQAWVMRRVLLFNLLDGDAELADQVWNPMDLRVTALTPGPQRDADNPLTFFIPYAATMILYIVIMMASSLLLSSVTNEKKNRVMEMLMLSVSPHQMLAGKIVGLGIAGLLQMVAWAGTGYTLLQLGGQTFDMPAGFELPPSIVAWGIVFFLLGYTLYASLMAGLGALAPSLRDASQATILVIWPIIIPLFFMMFLIEDPHGAIATGLSLFPLTAPISMMTRLAAGGVPLWQPLLAVALTLTTAYFVVRAVAGLFRAQTLLSGQPIDAKRFYKALLGRA